MDESYTGPTPSPWPEDDPEARLLSLVRTGDWLDAQDFPPLRWAVHGLIPQGFGLFTGPPKAGKSWAALDVALAVAAGGRALGKIPTGHPRPALYLALEDGDARLQWRARTLLGDGEPIPQMLHTVTTMTPGDVVQLIRVWLKQHGHRAPLVLLDTLGKVMPPALAGEGAYQRDYRIGGILKALVDAHPGSTLLVVHHVRKAHGEDWMDSTSGTNGLNGSADFTINLHRARNESTGVLRVTGRDVPESEYAVTSHDGCWTIEGATLADAAAAAVTARVTEGLGDRSTTIVELVNGHPEGIGPTEVALALGMEPKHAGEYLRRLESAGRIAKRGRGKYHPCPRVESMESVETEPPDSTETTVSTGVDRLCPDCGDALKAGRVRCGPCAHRHLMAERIEAKS